MSNKKIYLKTFLIDFSEASNGMKLSNSGDITSYDGDGSTYFTVDCIPGNPYSISFQKSGENGVLDITITNHEHDILDTDKTEAAYGLVGLRGIC